MIRWNTDANYNVLFFKFWTHYFSKKLRLQLIVQQTDYSAVLVCARTSIRYLFLPTFFVVNVCIDITSESTPLLLKSPAKVGNQYWHYPTFNIQQKVASLSDIYLIASFNIIPWRLPKHKSKIMADPLKQMKTETGLLSSYLKRD
jgi:hypothetical protein